MSVSGSTAAWIAIGAACVALVALALVAWGLVRLRRVRHAQQVLLGGGKGDLVDFAVSLQARIDDLHRAVDEVAAGLSRVDQRIDGSVGEDVDRPLRRLQGHRRPPVRLVALLDSGAHRDRPQRDPGTRLRAHLHEGARPRPRLGRALPRGDGGRRERADGLAAVARRSSPLDSRRRVRLAFRASAMQQVLVLNASYEPLNVTARCAVRTCSSSRARPRCWRS